MQLRVKGLAQGLHSGKKDPRRLVALNYGLGFNKAIFRWTLAKLGLLGEESLASGLSVKALTDSSLLGFDSCSRICCYLGLYASPSGHKHYRPTSKQVIEIWSFRNRKARMAEKKTIPCYSACKEAHLPCSIYDQLYFVHSTPKNFHRKWRDPSPPKHCCLCSDNIWSLNPNGNTATIQIVLLWNLILSAAGCRWVRWDSRWISICVLHCGTFYLALYVQSLFRIAMIITEKWGLTLEWLNRTYGCGWSRDHVYFWPYGLSSLFKYPFIGRLANALYCFNINLLMNYLKLGTL